VTLNKYGTGEKTLDGEADARRLFPKGTEGIVPSTMMYATLRNWQETRKND
jgi:hypothetical protein